MKTFRQGQILNLIRNQAIRTQEELASGLKKVGIEVTQVTLSRDIRELGLVKTPQGYRVQQEAAAAGEAEQETLKWMLGEFVRDVKTALHMVILKTAPGHAQPVALALDREGWPEIVGTIAGDDTIFAAASDPKQALKAKEKLLALMR
jgi:transcriptional regulator of arginine metabolism